MLALLFPGQGAQRVGMGRDVADSSAAARGVFAAADAALGIELTRLCFEGPEAELVRTEIQQPAILATSVALLRALEERATLAPTFAAGHSLGEYSALVACGALALDDALRLVRARGRYMQESVPEGEGGMAAVIGGEAGAVEEACARAREQTGECVEAANFNAPGQVVISGSARALEAAGAAVKAAGARRVRTLAVSAPFHCALMAPAAEKLASELAGVHFEAPRFPVVHDATAQPNTDPAAIPELLRRQVTAPVRFTEIVERLVEAGVTRVLEIGPKPVLTPMVQRIAPQLERATLTTLAELDAATEFAS